MTSKTFRRAGERASVIVGPSSQLAAALAVSVSSGAKVYDETTQRFEALYGKKDAEWFMNWSIADQKELPWPLNT